MIIFLDIDGVLTDGMYYHNEEGMIGKGFSTRDFHAINLFAKNGFNFVFLTAATDIATIKKIKNHKLKLIAGCKDKKEAVISTCIQQGYLASDCIFVGDGPQDICAMQACGQCFCPYDACHAVLSVPGVNRLESCGGKGVIDELLFKLFKTEYMSIMIK
jgi:YrbI family 3-deoxy-D-manno-octulosonate 8-phosphate phosphatase